MRTHNLKIDEAYFYAVESGDKKAEIRFNDRDYQVGDIIQFPHYPSTKQWRITHIFSYIGLKEGYVCLSIEPTQKAGG